MLPSCLPTTTWCSPSEIKIIGDRSNIPADAVFFSNGSGGKHAADPRLRRCGIGMAIIFCNNYNEPECWGGLSGTMPGASFEQTVPRSEIMAVIEIIRRTVGREHTHIKSDCKRVVDGFSMGKEWCLANSSLCDLWYDLWYIAEGRRISIDKVKAHASPVDVVAGLVAPFDFFGNHVADAWRWREPPPTKNFPPSE